MSRASAEAEPKPVGIALWLLVKGALYLVVLAALIQVLKNVLPNPFSAALISTVVVSLAASRLGLEEVSLPPVRQLLKAVVPGFVIGILLLVGAMVTGTGVNWSLPGASLGFGVLEACAIAYRDELWLRGMPLHVARRANIPDRATSVYLPLVAFAAVALVHARTIEGGLLVVIAAAFFTSLWLRCSNRWVVIAAHASWLFVSEGLLAGELASLGKGIGRVSAGANARGPAAWIAIACFSVLLVLVWRYGVGEMAAGSAEEDSGEWLL